MVFKIGRKKETKENKEEVINQDGYRENVKNVLQDDLQKAIEAELGKAALELREEQRKAIEAIAEEQKAAIRQIVEEEKQSIWERAEKLKQSLLKMSI